MRRSQVVVFLCCMLAITSVAQVPVNPYSGFIFTNPAYAGSTGATRIQASSTIFQPLQEFRNATFSAAGDTYLRSCNAGLGLSVASTHFKFFNTYRINGTWAQHFNVYDNNIKLVPALSLSFQQERVDPSLFSSSFPAQPGIIMVQNRGVVAMSFLAWFYDCLQIGYSFGDFQPLAIDKGASVFSLFSKAFNIAYSFKCNEESRIQLMYRAYMFHGFSQHFFSVNYLYKSFIAGAGGSTAVELYTHIGIRKEAYCASLQYQANYSRLGGSLFSGVSVLLSARIPAQTANQKNLPFERW